jgi:hypothetical protein
MASAGSVPEDTIPGAMPERWETAVEDFAQLVALGLDRAQDLADVMGELNRTRPGVTKLVAAGVGGLVAGAVLAGLIPKRRPSARQRAKRAAEGVRRAAVERATAIEQAAAVAQAAAQRLAERAPSASDIRGRMPRVDGAAIRARLPRVDRSEIADRASDVRDQARRRMSAPNIGVRQLGNAAKLLPLALALLRNPLVRAILWRSAARIARRR